jgi:catechol 2,3-dioxygenase-like lactoylglutathione lyase family enzyme
MSIKDATVLPVVAVGDIERAIRFYQEKLGCSVHRLEMSPDAVICELGRGERLLLYKSTMKRGETTAASIVVDDVEDTVTELRRRGVVFEEYDMPGLKTVSGIVTNGDFKSAWFKDSEGNVISVGSDLEGMMRKAA